MEYGPEVPWWKRRPFPAIVAVAIVVAFVFWNQGGGDIDESDLALLPKDSVYLFVIDVDAVYTSPVGKAIRSALGEDLRNLEDKAREQAGFGAEDLSYLVIGGAADDEPAIMLCFEDEPDDEQLAKLVDSLRLKNKDPKEVDGYRVWGTESSRMGMLEVRDETFLVAPSKQIKHALAMLESGDSNKLADLYDDHDLDEWPVAAVVDWRAAGGMPRDVQRAMMGIGPAIQKHLGPAILRAEVGDDIAAELLLLDADEKVVVRSTSEVDGDFVRALVDAVVNTQPQRERR